MLLRNQLKKNVLNIQLHITSIIICLHRILLLICQYVLNFCILCMLTMHLKSRVSLVKTNEDELTEE